MFTGIIKETGKVTEIAKKSGKICLKIETKNILKRKKIGQSISVNGVCLTIKKIEGKKVLFEIMKKTLEITSLKNIKKGGCVNLEPALLFGESIDGHLVQGHIDCTGKILEIKKEKSQKILKISFPKKYSKFLVEKGSIAVNGVSLTIAGLKKDSFEVCLVSHTLKITNLSEAKKNDIVNLEFDIISKYNAK